MGLRVAVQEQQRRPGSADDGVHRVVPAASSTVRAVNGAGSRVRGLIAPDPRGLG
ncbi:hypothetical protein [Pseudonocardia sp. ICBG601]|uniref:hypothetical protein n=1 Tax=Pseudonocardia sp. ICBG601 TaxID=2846759 RepID=UPI001CF6A671|nr:hypothetical protein [Pseudonocardia sp. ICBG601]